MRCAQWPVKAVPLIVLAACIVVPIRGTRASRSYDTPHLRQSLALLSSGRRNNAPVPEGLPVVKHLKEKGGGYTAGSPLYSKQSSQPSVEPTVSPLEVTVAGTPGPPLDLKPPESTSQASTPTVASPTEEPKQPAQLERPQSEQPAQVERSESSALPETSPPSPPPAARAAAEQQPPRVSTSIRCIITLIGQFFIIYTILFVLQTLNRLRVIERRREERSWASVVESVFFVPMLCVLFLAARIQAMQLAAGHPAAHDLPQWWVSLAMVVCTAAVVWAAVAQTCVAVANKAREESDPGKRQAGLSALARGAKISKNFAMALVYICFTIICLGVCLMQIPEPLQDRAPLPRVSPAVLCTVFLTVMYFGVYLGLVCVSLANELGLLGQRLRFCQALEYLKSATTTVVFSPMLCALFLACQAHAMQLDPVHGHPQGWAHTAFYVCCACVAAHTMVVVGGTIADMKEMQGEGLVHSKVRARGVEVLSLAFMTGLYTGVLAIIVSIYRFGNAPSSLSIHCITALTLVYFAVSWVHLSIPLVQRIALAGPNPRTGEPTIGEIFVGVLAKEAVAFCPKFCILFLGTVMRAAQLTDGVGAPQAWCQVMQCVASACIVLLTIVRLDVLVAEPGRLSTICTAVQYFCLSVLYASAIAIVVALFTLTKENATGWGAIAAV